jgi:hypothetical protein
VDGVGIGLCVSYDKYWLYSRPLVSKVLFSKGKHKGVLITPMQKCDPSRSGSIGDFLRHSKKTTNSKGDSGSFWLKLFLLFSHVPLDRVVGFGF